MARPLRFPGRLAGLVILLFLMPAGFAGTFALWSSLALSPLQKQYLAPYMALGVMGKSARPFPVWWIWKTAPKRHPELAANDDVIFAPGPVRHSQMPLRLSRQAVADGWTGLLRAPQAGRRAHEEAILQEQFFAGESFARMMVTPLCGMALAGLLFFGFREKFGSQTRHEERHGRRVKGPKLGRAFRWDWDGIWLQLQGKNFQIPRKLEASHILLMGDTGSGKSNAIRQILRQVEERGETAVVYDPAGEFVQEFYRPERKDVILNPLDARCPFWNLGAELDIRGIEDAVAAAMLPEKPGENGFFTDAPRRVLSALLRRRASANGLLEWMANPAEIERQLAGTPQAAYLDRKAGPQRAGVLASLNMIADSLALLPRGPEAEAWFDTGQWKHDRTRWVFLTSRPALRERILPLHSAWLDLLILRMMEPPANPAVKPVWFMLDELASLNKLPQLHTAVTENRKYGNPVVLGFQGRSQMEKRYGQDAEAMLSQPATKIFFKTSEPRAAKWISETLGEIEVERLRESRTPELIGSKKNYSMEIATKSLVMASEIAGLEPLHGYIKQGNRVLPVRFRLTKRRSLQPEFVERKMTIPEPRAVPPGIVSELPAAALPTPAKIAASATTPIVLPGPELPLFSEAAPPEPPKPEPRRSAFKKNEETAREWKPVD